MFLDKNSIMINNVSMGQYLLEATYGYNKLWASDSGRTLSGKMTGTLVGIFPKITMQFRKLTKSEVETLAPILDSAYQTTTYYDPVKQANTTISTYSSDWELGNKKIINSNSKNEGFQWSVIAVERRS